MTWSLYVSDNAIVLQTTVSVAMYVFNIERWIKKAERSPGRVRHYNQSCCICELVRKPFLEV